MVGEGEVIASNLMHYLDGDQYDFKRSANICQQGFWGEPSFLM